MKNFLFTLSLTLLFVISGCSKDDIKTHEVTYTFSSTGKAGSKHFKLFYLDETGWETEHIYDTTETVTWEKSFTEVTGEMASITATNHSITDSLSISVTIKLNQNRLNDSYLDISSNNDWVHVEEILP